MNNLNKGKVKKKFFFFSKQLFCTSFTNVGREMLLIKKRNFKLYYKLLGLTLCIVLKSLILFSEKSFFHTLHFIISNILIIF